MLDKLLERLGLGSALMVLMGAMDKDEEDAGEWLPVQGSGVKARRGGRKP